MVAIRPRGLSAAPGPPFAAPRRNGDSAGVVLPPGSPAPAGFLATGRAAARRSRGGRLRGAAARVILFRRRRLWRNWYTRRLQVPVGATPWRFESSQPHPFATLSGRFLPLSSRGLGRRPLTAETGVRIPVAVPQPRVRGASLVHHGTVPFASTKAPVGPLASMQAIRTMTSAPCSTVCTPRRWLKSVAV